MQQLTPTPNANVLVGPDGFSDAGVYRIDEDTAIVQSIDYFPPLVNDPFLFGQIAAANALSDLYAMGAKPITALNVVCFPDKHLPLSVLEAILNGGAERLNAAGAALLGGHSIRDEEVKFGLSVTGTVKINALATNRGAKPGDALVLTKPLGTGLVTTANRKDQCPEALLDAACRSMATLNDRASKAMLACGANAATDITGFGLAGHAREMADASGVTIELDAGDLPILPGCEALADERYFSRASHSNRDYASSSLNYESKPDPPRDVFLYDPQTSGGLLIAISPDRVETLLEQCQAPDTPDAVVVGRVTERRESAIVVRA